MFCLESSYARVVLFPTACFGKTLTFGPAVPIVCPNLAKSLLLCGYYPEICFRKFYELRPVTFLGDFHKV